MMFWCFFCLFVLMTVKIKHRKVLLRVIKFIVKVPFKILGFIGIIVYNVCFKSKVEARKAQLISDAMEEFLKEEQQISSQFGNDPIAMLRSRELDLRAQENARKDQESKDRINLDKMRAMMNQSTQDEKLQQNEDLAKLRADTSIEKTILAAKLKKDSEKSKNKV